MNQGQSEDPLFLQSGRQELCGPKGVCVCVGGERGGEGGSEFKT